MDRQRDDPSTSSSPEDVGRIRWCEESTTPYDSDQTAHGASRAPLNASREALSAGRRTPNPEFIEYGSFSMDVNAFERELEQKRERERKRTGERLNYPVQLKSTPKRPTHDASSPADHINVSIHHSGGRPHALHLSHSTDEVDHAPVHRTTTTRVISYEKISKTKTIREVTIGRDLAAAASGRSAQSPVPQPGYATEHRHSSVSAEHLDDSAYHSHRVRGAGGISTPTDYSVLSSSNGSLLHELDADNGAGAGGGAHRADDCAGMAHFQRAASEPPHFPSRSLDSLAADNRLDVSMNVVYAGNRSASGQPDHRHQWNLVSGVAGGNQPTTGRRHLARELFDSAQVDSDCSSPGWYNEYQAQTFHTDHQQPPRMDFRRSNSQYDNHIRQIRGISSNFGSFSRVCVGAFFRSGRSDCLISTFGPFIRFEAIERVECEGNQVAFICLRRIVGSNREPWFGCQR